MQSLGPCASIDSRPSANPSLGKEAFVGFRTFVQLVRSDLYRHTGTCDGPTFRRYLWHSPGFQYSFCLRLVAWLRTEQRPIRSCLPIARAVHRHLTYKYGISIPAHTRIGPGLMIGHFGDIVVNGSCVIGRNCDIFQGVTLGKAMRGPNEGTPTIGDNVYMGPGAKVVGRVTVGSNVAIGANAVITKDVPDNAVVGGVPGRILSNAGSAGYVKHTDYPCVDGEPPPTV